MILTKKRLQQIINGASFDKKSNQTKKMYKKSFTMLKHTNTFRHKKQYNLRNTTLKSL